MDSYLTGDEMLIKRSSIRYFGEREVHDDVLRKLFEVCRYAPTSKNSQSYYFLFLLAAWNFKLGTCWIGGMDRDDVKETLGIPQNHYVATVTPLGHPAEQPEPRSRRPSKEMVKFIK